MKHRSPSPRRVLHAAAIADAAGTLACPGVIVVEGDRIVAAGSPEAVARASGVNRIASVGGPVENLSNALVIPALVNTHAHLDLTHIGPQPFEGDFTNWVERLRANRARFADDIAASVRRGIELSRAGGTAAIGDIAGVRSLTPALVLHESGLAGVSFHETFGVGRTQSAAIDALRAAIDQFSSSAPEPSALRFGLQPHAPYSCGPDVFAAVAKTGLPLCTHLAETRDEIEFVHAASGPLADMLRRLGVWDDSIVGLGTHPIDHIAHLLNGRGLLAAHVNYADDRHLPLLAANNIRVAYCPRASTYFGHAHHRYRDMLAAGVCVALGTDSILCLDTPNRLSVLDEMRLLHRRDGTDPLTLLAMATINGARTLGLRESMFTLAPGRSAGLIALRMDGAARDIREAMAQALHGDDPPRWVLGPIAGAPEWFA